MRRDMIDPLTGAGNRRAFEVALTEGVERAVSTTSPLSVLDLDFDHFKRLNCDFGMSTGGRVLAEVARLLRDTLCDRGFLARTTGDGFTAVLPDTDLTTALETGERLRRAVAKWRGRVSRSRSRSASAWRPWTPPHRRPGGYWRTPTPPAAGQNPPGGIGCAAGRNGDRGKPGRTFYEGDRLLAGRP